MDRVFWYDVEEVISARKRLDGQWGWQCTCGNTDIMTAQEKRMITNPQQPKPEELSAIVQSIQPQEARFEMVTV